MTITQIDTNIQKLIKSFKKESFLYDFLLFFGLPKATIARLKKGSMNMSKVPGETLLKKKLLFKELGIKELEEVMEKLQATPTRIKHNPRFFILTDYKRLLAYDTKTKESLDTTIKALTK